MELSDAAFRRLGLALLASAALLSAVAAPAPAAALSGEEGAEAPTASLEFTRPTASLVGSRVLVRVRCGGSAQEPCVGTLAVKAACGSHKLPYSIDYGEEQIVPVPVGSDGQAIGRLKSVRAVARTLQSSGASLATGERLRIR